MVVLILVNARRETRDARRETRDARRETRDTHNLNFSFHSLFLKLYYVYLLSIRLLNSISNSIISFYKFFNLIISVLSLSAYYKKLIYLIRRTLCLN